MTECKCRDNSTYLILIFFVLVMCFFSLMNIDVSLGRIAKSQAILASPPQ